MTGVQQQQGALLQFWRSSGEEDEDADDAEEGSVGVEAAWHVAVQPVVGQQFQVKRIAVECTQGGRDAFDDADEGRW
jgi:hypothetical protein